MRFRLGLLGALALLCGGCSLTGGSDPASFYVMTSRAEQINRSAVLATDLSVGVGPITFPDYLKRPEMVFRVSEHELIIDDFNRWAESVESGFARLLGENLVVMLGASVVNYPWYATRAPQYAISVDVARFEVNQAWTATLICRWTIRNSETRERLFFKESVFSQPVDTAAGIQASVAALSALMDSLSQEVATEMRRVSEGSP